MKPLRNYIDENLNTHSYFDLQKQLMKEYSNEIDKFVRDKNDKFSAKSPFYIRMKGDYDTSKKLGNELMKQPKFKKILSLYNYFVSYNSGLGLYIEPTFPDNANNIIYNECNGIVWHLAYNHNVYNILNNGFKIKEPSYRHYPARIYVYATKHKDPLSDKDDFIDFVSELGRLTELNKQTLLKIDLSHTQHNIDFYNDVAMKCKHAFFTYTNIPAKYISIAKFDVGRFKKMYYDKEGINLDDYKEDE